MNKGGEEVFQYRGHSNWAVAATVTKKPGEETKKKLAQLDGLG